MHFRASYESMIHWKERFLAAGVHLGLSLSVALAAAVLVFIVWYPQPYAAVSGGRDLFLLVVIVDVVLGPLLTLAVFNRTKPNNELRRDILIIAVLQLGGLLYGLWTVFAARPVHLCFEIDRFRVVHAIDVPTELLDRTPMGIEPLPLWGPTLLAVRPFRDPREKMEATLAAISGVELSYRPDLWQPYAHARERVIAAGLPVSILRKRFAANSVEIDRAVKASGFAESDLLYLPMNGRKVFWTVLIDRQEARPRVFVPIDAF